MPYITFVIPTGSSGACWEQQTRPSKIRASSHASKDKRFWPFILKNFLSFLPYFLYWYPKMKRQIVICAVKYYFQWTCMKYFCFNCTIKAYCLLLLQLIKVYRPYCIQLTNLLYFQLTINGVHNWNYNDVNLPITASSAD